jgi:DNA helicase II / ATP-dependent DNA helicase PcrA
MDPLYLDGLNPVQRDAVMATDGPVLILAGAGTGKTRVLTTRLAHILYTQRAYPSQILAVTFTNKAAHEMKERVARLLGTSIDGGWIGTFHAIAARMLRRHAELIGLTPQFTILDEDDQLRVIKQISETYQLDPKKNPPRLILNMIERWKDRARLPSDITRDDAGDVANGLVPQIYRDYQERLRALNCCDFGDLMLHVISILRDPKNAAILSEWHRRFRYILVDEYQDTNVAQYLWLRLLAQGHGNLCCVGDDDQSIYGWRGAEIGNILKFEHDFPNAQVFRLEQNYRSTGHILAAASSVIAQNTARLGKTLWSQGDKGEKIQVRGVWDGEAEARFIGEEIESLQQKKYSLKHMGVLVRTGFQMREFEERFIQLGLNYRVFGGPRFYERQEIRDALAYFRVVAQPQDDLAFERIINVPKRGLGDATLKTLHDHARAHKISLFHAADNLCRAGSFKPKVQGALGKLIDDFHRWQSLLNTASHTELAGQILDESGYITMWQVEKSPDSQGRVDNLRELIASMADFESLTAFLEHVALVLEVQGNADQDDYISLMTLHGAKGLEFDVVFLPGWEEGLFPSQRSMDENGMKGLEEERRLAYVGITRARKNAYITFAANRRMYGQYLSNLPSRFIDELPKDSIVTESSQGLYNPGRSQHWDSDGLKPPPSASFHLGVDESLIRRGDVVHHEIFGTGKVIQSDGKKLDIVFEDGSQKRLMSSFVEKITA